MDDETYYKEYIKCYNFVLDIVQLIKDFLYPSEYSFQRMDDLLSIEDKMNHIKNDLESVTFEKEISKFFIEILEFYYPSKGTNNSFISSDLINLNGELSNIKDRLEKQYMPFIKMAETRNFQEEYIEEHFSDEEAWEGVLLSQVYIEDINNILNDIIWSFYHGAKTELINETLMDRYKLNSLQFSRYMNSNSKNSSSIKKINKKKSTILADFKKFDKYFEDIFGQEDAIKKIRKTLLRNILFYNAEDLEENENGENKSPLATFMFYGPTGTGKTETAKQMAKFVFGDDKKLLILDMNSYKDSKVASSALKGHPEGYVDSSKGTDFTRFLQKNDKGIIVLDEFEKSSTEVRELFMTMLDEGYFKDALGNKYDLSGYIFVATTNVSKVFENRPRKIGFQSDNVEEEKKQEDSRIKDDLRNIFTAPIINRFNEVIGFNEIKKEHAIMICANIIKKLVKKFESKKFNGINPTIRFENIDQIIEIILKESNFRKDGVRSLTNVINDMISSQILEEIVNGNDQIKVVGEGDKIILTSKVGNAKRGENVYKRKIN